MTDEVKDRKFSKLFDWFDQDGDGLVTRDDIQAMGGLFTALAPEGDNERPLALRDGFQHWWELLLANGDANGDGRITRENFSNVVRSQVTAPQAFQGTVLKITQALTEVLDTNGDGVLRRNEYVQAYAALGVTPEDAAGAFDRIDRDGDGVISHNEFRQAVTEFYLSPDENAPGNWLLGPLGQTV